MNCSCSIYKSTLGKVYRALKRSFIKGNPCYDYDNKEIYQQVKRAFEHNLPFKSLAFVQTPNKEIYVADGIQILNCIRTLTGKRITEVEQYTQEIVYSLYEVDTPQDAVHVVSHFQNISYCEAIRYMVPYYCVEHPRHLSEIFFENIGDVFKKEFLFRKVESAFFRFLFYYTNCLIYDDHNDSCIECEDLTIEDNITRLMLTNKLPALNVLAFTHRLFEDFIVTFRTAVTKDNFTQLHVLFSSTVKPFEIDAEVLFLLFYANFCRVSSKNAPLEQIVSRIIMLRTSNYCGIFKKLPQTCREGKEMFVKIKNLVLDRVLLPKAYKYDLSWYNDVESTIPLDVCSMLDLAEDKSDEFKRCVNYSFDCADLRENPENQYKRRPYPRY